MLSSCNFALRIESFCATQVITFLGTDIIHSNRFSYFGGATQLCLNFFAIKLNFCQHSDKNGELTLKVDFFQAARLIDDTENHDDISNSQKIEKRIIKKIVRS